MWIRMFSGFFEHFAASVLLWFILMALFGLALAREKFRRFINGLGRLAGSAFSSPVVYLQRAARTVASYDEKGEDEIRATDQYLLNKLLLGLQAGVIVLALGSLAAGLITTWNVLLPPKEVRDAIKEHKTRIEENEKSLAETDEKLTVLDTAWTSQRDGIIQAYQNERRSTKTRRNQERTAIERRASGTNLEYILTEMKGALARLGEAPSWDDLERTQDRLNNSVRWSWYLGAEERSQGWKWVEAWHAAAVSDLELRTLDEEQIRLGHQNDLGPLRERKKGLETALELDRNQLETLRQQAKLNFVPAFFSLLGTILSVLILIWLLGLLVESLWMAVHLAGDVKRIRQSMDKEEVAEQKAA